MRNRYIKKFILPNYMGYGRNEFLIKLYKKYSYIMMDDSCIYSFYGTFPNAIFNGGRLGISKYNTSTKEMKRVKKFYNSNGIRITLTFTNQCLEEKHLTDKYCNNILKIFHDGFNEVLVASSLLEDYIRTNYPKFKINKSITATILDGDEDTTNYNLVVIDKEHNKDYEYLKAIKDKEKVELLCDEVCVNDCAYRKQHYKELSLIQLGTLEDTPEVGKCRYENQISEYSHLYNRNHFSKYYISPIYMKNLCKMGFEYFKLSGRPKYYPLALENILHYLIKEKYFDDIFTYIMEIQMLELEKDLKYDKKS